MSLSRRFLRALRAAWAAFRASWRMSADGRYRVLRDGVEAYIGNSAREMQVVWQDGKRSGGVMQFWDGSVLRDWYPRT